MQAANNVVRLIILRADMELFILFAHVLMFRICNGEHLHTHFDGQLYTVYLFISPVVE